MSFIDLKAYEHDKRIRDKPKRKGLILCLRCGSALIQHIQANTLISFCANCRYQAVYILPENFNLSDFQYNEELCKNV